MLRNSCSEAFLEGGGEFGYKNHVAVVQDGRVIGIGAAYGRDTSLPFMLVAVRQILRFYGVFSGIGVIVRGLRTERIMPPPHKKGMHYIAHLGIASEVRGQGIGSKLIDYLLAEGRKMGLETADLDVSVENPRAQQLYERLEFVVTQERQSRLKNSFGHVANHRRMVRKL